MPSTSRLSASKLRSNVRNDGEIGTPQPIRSLRIAHLHQSLIPNQVDFKRDNHTEVNSKSQREAAHEDAFLAVLVVSCPSLRRHHLPFQSKENGCVSGAARLDIKLRTATARSSIALPAMWASS